VGIDANNKTNGGQLLRYMIVIAWFDEQLQ